MANTKISQLTENTSPNWAEELVYAYNSTNWKMTLNTMKTFVQPDLSSYATVAQVQAKQDKLTSWVNIKTVNWNSILGTWDINTNSTYTEYDYSAMRWPCPAWYHIPQQSEWLVLYNTMVALWISTSNWDFSKYLKIPLWWYRAYNQSWAPTQNVWLGSFIGYSTATSTNTTTVFTIGASNVTYANTMYRAMWISIRPFKDTAVIPDNTWTELFDWSLVAQNAWIFHDTVNEIISISSNWVDWLTIADKNLWATVVWNYWDTPSASNSWYFYQWWNNNWFAGIWWSVTTSATQVDASTYWPWNYYSSNTFITNNRDWSNTQNDNLWWWVTWVVETTYDIYNNFQLVWTSITIWWKYIWWIAWDVLSWSYTLNTWNNSFVWQEHYLCIPTQTNNYSLTAWTWVNNPFNLTLPSSTKKACLVKFYCDSVSTMIISDCKIAS